jgi:Alpha/beta hydrolase domain
VFVAAAVAVSTLASAAGRTAVAAPGDPVVEGPIPGALPGDRMAADVAETYPFFSTTVDLAAAGYVEEEFYLSGAADAYTTAGVRIAEDVPYRTRVIVRRPTRQAAFNGTVLTEWQNVTAGYDLDALWSSRLVRAGYTWIGVSAQRVGVNFLREWSPARYGDLDVTGFGAFVTDQLSYEIFAQAAAAVMQPSGADLLGGLDAEQVLAIGASQSAGRMTVYYNAVLPQVTPVFDGYVFIVGSAPSRVGPEPVFQVLSETDVTNPATRRPDSDVFRRWEVAGSAHSGYEGQVYRRPISDRDLPTGAPTYECTLPPFSRVPLGQVVAAAYDHLASWAADGTAPPHAPYLEFDGLTKVRNELGLAQGGIQLSQVAVPIALNTGSNSGPSFCFLFGTHQPFDEATLQRLYRSHGQYVSRVARVDAANVEAGYLLRDDATLNQRAAAQSDIGK